MPIPIVVSIRKRASSRRGGKALVLLPAPTQGVNAWGGWSWHLFLLAAAMAVAGLTRAVRGEPRCHCLDGAGALDGLSGLLGGYYCPACDIISDAR
jgi:hypothetical protein